MSQIKKKQQQITDNIKDYHTFFEPNFKRYHHFMKFVFETSLSPDDISLMQEQGKPQIEFNVLEAHISRLRGEFAKQEPAFSVRQSDDGNDVDPRLIDLIEGHMRAILFDSNRDNMEYDIFTDVLGGGFSAIKVYTDYASEKSFNQNIYLRRVYNPTLVGFDKLARASHKGDGRCAYELYPMSRAEFEKKFGAKYTEKMDFSSQIGGFNWSYSSSTGEEVVLVGDYYEKQEREAKIVQLIDGRVMTDDEYQMNLEHWRKQSDVMIQMPGIVGRPRKTKFTTIAHYQITENDIIHKDDTDYKYLPLVFVDGNSMVIQRTSDGPLVQVTRPYVYHAEGIQRLKNFAGITLANELESMLQSKFMAYKESIPAEYKDAWMEPQIASILIANGFKDDDPAIPLPLPTVVPRVPAPPEVMGTFMGSDQIIQSVLGNYDAMQGSNMDGRLSGIAIQRGATQSNSASMPWNVGYMKAWNRVSEIVLDLLPKYYTLPRSIPVQDLGGKRTHQKINEPGYPYMEYDSSEMEVVVSAGVNFEIQRQEALDTLQGLMKTAPAFAEIIGETPEGCEMILSNIDIRGIDALKKAIPKFFEQRAQMQQQQQQMAQQMNPLLIKQAEIKQKEQKAQMDFIIDEKHVGIEQQQADTDRILALNEIGDKADKNELQSMKIAAEESRTEVERMHKENMHNKDVANHKHNHAMDLLNLHHTISNVIDKKLDNKNAT
jgi:hypothetical protein